MTRIKQTLKIYVNCRYRTVTAPLCPMPDQGAKTMLNFALRTTAIPGYPPETDGIALAWATCTVALRNPQPGARLQSP
jgi:hypothetical protein